MRLLLISAMNGIKEFCEKVLRVHACELMDLKSLLA